MVKARVGDCLGTVAHCKCVPKGCRVRIPRDPPERTDMIGGSEAAFVVIVIILLIVGTKVRDGVGGYVKKNLDEADREREHRADRY